jgi:hypothetical protein
MKSHYDGAIPPGWDRSDPAGSLIDVSTGAPIREVDHGGGWIRLQDGLAARDNDPAFNPVLRQDQQIGSNAAELLLLF